MTRCDNRETCLINLRQNIDSHTVNNVVRATVDDDTFYIGECLEFIYCDVMRLDFAVDAKGADGSCKYGVLVTAEVQNNNHVLFHISDIINGFFICCENSVFSFFLQALNA